MYKRKYQNYKIVVKKENGQKETTDMKKYDVDTDSYKGMLNAYKEIKENYKDNPVEISFCGISDAGDLDIIFKREGKKKEIIGTKDDENFNNKSVEEVNEIMKNIINYYTEKMVESLDMSYKDKEINNINHISMNLDVESMNKDQMKNFILKMQEANIDRKDIKNKIALQSKIKGYYGTIKSMKKFYIGIRDILYGFEIAKTKGKEKYKLENEENLIKKKPYKNFSERMELMKRLHKKYPKMKIINDNENKELICYNKCVEVH